MHKDRFRQGTIDVHQQGTFVERLWPGFEYSICEGQLTCQGRVRPSSISPDYEVRVEYRAPDHPKVHIDNPPLSRRPEEPKEPIPHTHLEFRPGEERPCLYFEKWHPSRYIAFTILPWTCEWLTHYEIWHQTGVWTGGGIEHQREKRGYE